MTLEGGNLLQIQKWWDAILSTFCQSLSSTKILPACKYVKSENHNISSFILPPDTHPKFTTAKENIKHYQYNSEFILLNIKLFPTLKQKKSHFKLIKCMNNENGFDLLIASVFSISPQL